MVGQFNDPTNRASFIKHKVSCESKRKYAETHHPFRYSAYPQVLHWLFQFCTDFVSGHLMKVAGKGARTLIAPSLFLYHHSKNRS